jgi:hypothetical protein
MSINGSLSFSDHRPDGRGLAIVTAGRLPASLAQKKQKNGAPGGATQPFDSKRDNVSPSLEATTRNPSYMLAGRATLKNAGN